MKRHLMIAAVLAVAALALGRHAAEWPQAAADEVKKEAKPPYVHTVIFHVKKDAPEGAAEGLIRDAHDLLTKIPTVRELRCGRPADKATPEIAKKDYTVGLVIFFNDYDGLKTYLDHPSHVQYVKRHLKNIDQDKLIVYDFMNQEK
jgi:hypothetical protein